MSTFRKFFTLHFPGVKVFWMAECQVGIHRLLVRAPLHAAHDLGVVEELDGLDHDDAGEAEEGAHDEDQEQEADRGALGAGVPGEQDRF